MLKMKEQDKTPEEQLSKVETDNLPEKEYMVTVVNNIIVAPEYPFSLFQTHINTSTTVTEGPKGLDNTMKE